MALRDLVLYFARRRAQRPNRSSLSQVAQRHNWAQAEVLAFLHFETEASKKMLRELAQELDVTVEELQQVLDR